MTPYYSPRVFERVNLALLDIFDKIQINRYNPDGTVHKIIRVPVTFHYSKIFADYILNSQTKQESKHTTPILGLRSGTPKRNISGRTATSYIRQIYDVETNRIIRDMTPSPWIFTYTLTSYAENIYDHWQMMENIMTYFNPYFNLRLKEFQFSNIKRDVIVELVSVNPQYNDEVEREKTQSYVTDYTFDVKFDMYAPMYLAYLIKEINIRIANSGQNIGEITNIEVDNVTIDTYNRAMDEIVKAGKILDTVVVDSVNISPLSEARVVVNVNDATVVPLISLPPGAKIDHIELIVNNNFDDYNALVSVGTGANNSLLFATTDSNLSIETKYIQDISIPVTVNTQFNVYYNKAIATKGQFEVLIRWSF